MKKLLTLSAAIAASVAVSACGVGPDGSREDAVDVPPSAVDKAQPHVLAFNNHYPNIEQKCDGFGHRVFVATHDSARGRNIIILPDPTCPGYVKGEPAVAVSP